MCAMLGKWILTTLLSQSMTNTSTYHALVSQAPQVPAGARTSLAVVRKKVRHAKAELLVPVIREKTCPRPNSEQNSKLQPA
jgi:hypothetical protein